mmetsp:Transcript_94625/g.237390  ORF Transcript_94625/g.237390 Transcript_94625/m.237390 type:complete len:240 (-) Transcript_94625:337-1056(-)|eukprot:CAMPEP_0115652874 /NCGR_PEP_ID=MMETSP0272-20121206/42299_1 /TAXON_ID=71861 /ORGANISM="Scrippsiella trochoidea, Strain CCMP3099" /LENGTH=239 /DNA_ID=CAMNT_0003090703 /DNA_START=106 /DNA_END=825 /DNA_ORIENTATION=+
MAQLSKSDAIDAARLKPHLRSMVSYLATYANILDYFRAVFYCAALYGHIQGIWWVMPFAIIMNGIIDEADGKVARALDQCSKFGYIIDCACDNLAVATNTGCIAQLALQSSMLPPWVRSSTAAAMYIYCFFFMFWSALASVCMGLVPEYKAFHRSPWAKWYYGGVTGDVLYLGMQAWWVSLYMVAQGTHAAAAFTVLAITTPVTLVKVAIEVENVIFMTVALKDADAKQCLADSASKLH